MFGEFVYPDGSKPTYEEIDKLQRMFMKLHREIRLISPVTFPVTTSAALHDGKDFKDLDFKEWIAEEWSKGSSFFSYISDKADSLSSCCFSPDTKVLWKSSTKGVNYTSLKELHELKWEPNKNNLRIFHNGFWIKGNTIKTDNTNFYKVTTSNHKTFYMTDNHINVTIDGEKQTKDLTVNDYLMFNTNTLNSITENDENLTYEQGFTIGAFLGDGSFGKRFKDGTIYDINYSQNINKYKTCIENINKANHQLGQEGECVLKELYNNVYPIRISSKELVTFIQKWTNWKEGTYSYNKELNLDCLLQSVEFRKGILDGWYNTDGGNSNRCYTTSEKLKDCMEILITSLGLNSIIDVSDKTDEKVVIRGEEFNRNYPLYCVRWYTPCNKIQSKNIYKWKNNAQYFKITNIEKLLDTEHTNSYCIECTDKENPYFTLPSGLITHNCRLKNELAENIFSSTTGMTGVQTGSCNVITLNINRIIQDWYKSDVDHILFEQNYNHLKDYLRNILKRVAAYHYAYKEMLYNEEEKGMFSSNNAGYISESKLYSTIGVLGYGEGAKFLGLEVSKNDAYIKYLQVVLGTIKDFNIEASKKYSAINKARKYMFNTEAVPGESLGVKLYNWDKEDGYKVPENQNLYNCYFYNPWDNTTILDKVYLHGSEINEYLSGGQSTHLNLDAHLSKEQYKKIIDYAIKVGNNYFTFNIPISKCKECNNVVNAPIKECPKCNSKEISYYTRIIGYLTCVDNWQSERQTEFGFRNYLDGDKEIKD